MLLTGATGFVGFQILKALVGRAEAVSVVVRAGSEKRLGSLANSVEVITTLDLFKESHEWWRNVCRNVDTVVHVAWYTEPGKYLHSPRNLDCLAGTLQAAKGAAAAEVRRFIGVGTCFEYDLKGGRLGVDTPLRPSNAYAAAKAAAFIALNAWLPLQRVDFAWCRLFYLFGEGEDARRLVPYVRSRLAAGEPAELTHGGQIRDFLDVAVAGRLIADVALSDTTGPVNICSGIPITVRQLVEQIGDEYGRRDLLLFGARPDNPEDPACVVGVRNEI